MRVRRRDGSPELSLAECLWTDDGIFKGLEKCRCTSKRCIPCKDFKDPLHLKPRKLHGNSTQRSTVINPKRCGNFLVLEGRELSRVPREVDHEAICRLVVSQTPTVVPEFSSARDVHSHDVRSHGPIAEHNELNLSDRAVTCNIDDCELTAQLSRVRSLAKYDMELG